MFTAYLVGEEYLLRVVVVFVCGKGQAGAFVVGVFSNDLGGGVVAEFGV